MKRAKPPTPLAQLRFTEETEVAQIFLAGLIATGRVGPDAIVRVWIDNLEAYAFNFAPPAVVVDVLGTRPKDGAQV